MSDATTTNGNGNGTSKVQFWISILLAVGALFGAGYNFLGRLSQLEFQVAQLNAQAAATENRFSTQIGSLENRQGRTEDRILAARTDITQLQAGAIEIETQFCGNDHLRNLMHANDMRIQAMLWQKVFPDSTLTTDNAYYPMVCNRKNDK